MTEGKLEFPESESHHREKPKHSTSHDMAAHNCISPETTEQLRRQAFELPPREQYRLAWFIAENIGYVLAEEPPHPDSPHHPDNKRWTPKQYWEYVSALVGEFERNQMRDMLVERGLHILGSAQPSTSPGTAHDPLAGLAERLDRLLLTSTENERFVLATESANNIVGIMREWLRTTGVAQSPDAYRKAIEWIASVEEPFLESTAYLMWHKARDTLEMPPVTSTDKGLSAEEKRDRAQALAHARSMSSTLNSDPETATGLNKKLPYNVEGYEE